MYYILVLIHQYPSQLIQMLTLTLRWSHLLIDIFGHSYGNRLFSHDSRSGDKPDHISEKWWDFWTVNEVTKTYGKHQLVGGLEHEFYFSIYWQCHHPNWRIFFRGVETTNQSMMALLKARVFRVSVKHAFFWGTEETKGIPSAVLLQVKNKAHKSRRPKQLLLYWSHVGNSQTYDDFWHHIWRFPQYSYMGGTPNHQSYWNPWYGDDWGSMTKPTDHHQSSLYL